MDNNQNNFRNGNGEKEEIRFDERDFQNPYSKYYSQSRGDSSQSTDSDFGNPYSRYYNNSDTNQNGGDRTESEPIDFGTYNRPGKTYLELQKDKKNFSRIGFGYALFSIITFAVSLIIANVVYRINSDVYNSTLFMNALTPIALYIFALPVLLILLSGSEAKPPEKRKMKVGTWFVILIVAFGCMYIGSYIGNFVMAYLSSLMNYDYSNALETIIDENSLWITAIFTVIVAPIGEEFVFRKLIIDRTQKYGAFVSIGLSALMFGLMHGNFYQFFYCFALGIILGYIYYSTGNLFATIAMHAAINFVGGILSSLLQSVLDGLISLDTTDAEAVSEFVMDNALGIIGMSVFSLFVFASMICAVVLPIVFRKKLDLPRGSDELPRSRVFNTVIVNAGVITMLAVYLFEFGLNLLPF